MSVRKVRVLINPRSGLVWSPAGMQKALRRIWDVPGIDLTFQFSNSARDGMEKTRRGLADGVDTFLVIGGDGMLNSIGSALLGSRAALGVIPAGSGNGFARHFGIPLNPERAALALRQAERHSIDVGLANGRPFFVTCSMAWDAAIARTFEKSPVRGILPYVLSGAYELLEYQPQPFSFEIDGEENLAISDPLVFTVANLTQYGGGLLIAPDACPDDGKLELVAIKRKDLPRLLTHIHRVFDGTLHDLPEVITRTFSRLEVRRAHPGPIQVDGEYVAAPADVEVTIRPRTLNVLVPFKAETNRP